jgi:ribosomal protein L2
MEEIETTAISSSKRTIQKMEMRIVELEEFLSKEKGMHVETTTVLHKKERSVKELLLQSEEDRKNILILQESLERLNEKIKMYKRQLEEQEAISNSNIMRVKKIPERIRICRRTSQRSRKFSELFPLSTESLRSCCRIQARCEL